MFEPDKHPPGDRDQSHGRLRLDPNASRQLQSDAAEARDLIRSDAEAARDRIEREAGGRRVPGAWATALMITLAFALGMAAAALMMSRG